jgi:hypothetical protein
LHLDIAVAPRRLAEAAFFESDATPAGDELPRARIDGVSEYELTVLARVLDRRFEPSLAVDSELPEDIISELDPRFVAALAATDQAIDALTAERWRAALADASPGVTSDRLAQILAALREFAQLSVARHHALLYTQCMDHEAPADD